MAAPLTASFASLDAPIVAAPSAWTGHFVHEERGGAIRHELVLAPRRCALSTTKSGVTDQVACDAIVRDDSLILLARDDGGYRRGTPLLKLVRENGGIVTYWLGYANAPADVAAGHHFIRRWS